MKFVDESRLGSKLTHEEKEHVRKRMEVGRCPFCESDEVLWPDKEEIIPPAWIVHMYLDHPKANEFHGELE